MSKIAFPSIARWHGNSTGFTLVELLVVMGVIGVLAALSLAAFKNVMPYAERSKCTSNLHQIGLSLNNFASDNEQEYPQTGIVIPLNSVDVKTGKPSWMEQLISYGAEKKSFICPSSTFTAPNDYFLSSWAAYYANEMQYPTPAVKVLSINNPAAMILAGDCTFGNSGDDADPDDAGPNNIPFTGKPFHGKYYNLLFADGHVQACASFDKTRMTNRYEGLGYDYNSAIP